MLDSHSKYKIRIKSPEHSEKVQKYLFSLGYRWGGSRPSTNIMNKGFRNISIYPNVKEFWCFNNVKLCQDYIEVELLETISYEFKEIPKKEVVTIGEKSYYIDELEIALKNINPI